MAENNPYRQMLVDFERPGDKRQWVQQAEAMVERAEACDDTSHERVCVHHELIMAQHSLDEVGYAPAILERVEALMAIKQGMDPMSGQCKGCLLGSKADALMALERYEEARAALQESLENSSKDGRSKWWALNKTAEALWDLARIETLLGNPKAAREVVARHDDERRFAIECAQAMIDNPNNAQHHGHYRHTIQNANEAIREMALLDLAAHGKYLQAAEGIAAYLGELGDGGSGMTSIMHAVVTAAAAAEAWEALLALAPIVGPEFESRGAVRRLALLRLHVARAHLELGDRIKARTLLFELEDGQSDLIGADMEPLLETLRQRLRDAL